MDKGVSKPSSTKKKVSESSWLKARKKRVDEMVKMSKPYTNVNGLAHEIAVWDEGQTCELEFLAGKSIRNLAERFLETQTFPRGTSLESVDAVMQWLENSSKRDRGYCLVTKNPSLPIDVVGPMSERPCACWNLASQFVFFLFPGALFVFFLAGRFVFFFLGPTGTPEKLPTKGGSLNARMVRILVGKLCTLTQSWVLL